MSNLPPPPVREDFEDPECYEEARAYWQGHIGRLHAIAAQVRKHKTDKLSAEQAEKKPEE